MDCYPSSTEKGKEPEVKLGKNDLEPIFEDHRNKLKDIYMKMLHNLEADNEQARQHDPLEASRLSVLLAETKGRIYADDHLLDSIVILASFIDMVNETFDRIIPILQGLTPMKGDLAKIQSLVSEHDKTYQQLQGVLDNAVKNAEKELSYVQ